ncbi:MAG: TIGR00282 family metallophosphoesterase [Pseudomonadota bacterium]
MRFLFLGDVVGRAGRRIVQDHLPRLRRDLQLDFVVVNGENAAGGFGITEAIHESLLEAGADAVTLGNHAFDQRELLVSITRQDRLLRPLNYPDDTPGRGVALIKAKTGASVLVINALGRIFMSNVECPFRAIDREIGLCPLKEGADAIIVDFHAEATSEKQAMGHYLDGRASVVVGTHTHTPTADERVLAGGTAYQTDAGMCGDYTSVIGMNPAEPINRFLSPVAKDRMEPASGTPTLSGLAVEIDDTTGLAKHAAALRFGGDLTPRSPPFWSA